MRRTAVIASLAGVLVLCGRVAAEAQTSPLPQLTLRCTQGTPLGLQIAIQNEQTEPTAVAVGGILGNDRQYLLSELSFVVHRADVPDTTIPYVDPTFNGRIGGRLDEWLVALPPGSSYSIMLPLTDAVRRSLSGTAEVSARLLAQPHTNTSTDLAALRFVHLWTGTLASEPIRIPESCSQGQ